MSKLQLLLAKAQLANEQAGAELLRMYPKGSEISFTITSGQRNASTGTVIGLGWGQPGYVRVEHHQAKPNSRYAYRDVHYSMIVGGSKS